MTLALLVSTELYILYKENVPEGGFIITVVFFAVACFAGSMWGYYSEHTDLLQTSLGVDDLRLYVGLSPSQMEDLCLRRLKVLGSAWEEAQRNHPMPFAKERTEAERAFRGAYRRFEEHKCIKPTKWDRFFSEPETQK